LNQLQPTTDTTRTPRPVASTVRRAERHSRTAVLPPVPLSVWLAQPLTGCCPTCDRRTSEACAQRLPQGLARQITDAYSRAGQVVFVADTGNEDNLLLAVARSGRAATSSARGEPLAPKPIHRLTYPRGGRVHGRPTHPVTRIAPGAGVGVNGRRPLRGCQDSATNGHRKDSV
jgi:hypothetical protein